MQCTLQIAVEAYKGQLRKEGHPHNSHSVKLVLPMNSDAQGMAAVLRGVMGYTTWYLKLCQKKACLIRIVDAVECLRHPESISCDTYIAPRDAQSL